MKEILRLYYVFERLHKKRNVTQTEFIEESDKAHALIHFLHYGITNTVDQYPGTVPDHQLRKPHNVQNLQHLRVDLTPRASL